MPKITKEKYKKDLKDQIRAELKKMDHTDRTRKGLRFWVEFNKAEKAKLDAKMKTKGDTVG